MQTAKILLFCLALGACSNTNEVRKEESPSNIEQTTYKSKSKVTYLTLNTYDGESDSFHPAHILINGIMFDHFEKGPFIQRVIDGEFDIRVVYVSKLRTFIEKLYIASGDSVVLDINMQDDLSPLYDR